MQIYKVLTFLYETTIMQHMILHTKLFQFYNINWHYSIFIDYQYICYKVILTKEFINIIQLFNSLTPIVAN